MPGISRPSESNDGPVEEHCLLAEEISDRSNSRLRELALHYQEELCRNERFQIVHRVFHRVVDHLEEGSAGGNGAVPDDARQSVLDAFRRYSESWLEHLNGLTPKQVAEKLGMPAARKWINSGFIPGELLGRDPEFLKARVKQASIPQGFSPDFAYILGAFCATVRIERSDHAVTFTNQEAAPLRRLQEALKAACQFDGNIIPRRVRDREFEMLAVRSPNLLPYLGEVTKWNSQLPWERLLTAEERRAFLRGFFDFARGDLSLEEARLNISRSAQSETLAGVCILLQREGIYPRYRLNQTASLVMQDVHDLKKLHALGVVQSEHLAQPLAAIVRSGRDTRDTPLEEYFGIMKAASELRRVAGDAQLKITPGMALRAAGAQSPFGARLLMQVGRWLNGEEPRAMWRVHELKELESKILPAAELSKIGAAIISRLGSASRSPVAVVRAISEWIGGSQELSGRAGVSHSKIEQLLHGQMVLKPDEYLRVLLVAGIDNRFPAMELQEPEHADLKKWTPKKQWGVLSVYQAAVYRTALDAFRRGESPQQAVRDKVNDLARRYSVEEFGRHHKD